MTTGYDSLPDNACGDCDGRGEYDAPGCDNPGDATYDCVSCGGTGVLDDSISNRP